MFNPGGTLEGIDIREGQGCWLFVGIRGHEHPSNRTGFLPTAASSWAGQAGLFGYKVAAVAVFQFVSFQQFNIWPTGKIVWQQNKKRVPQLINACIQSSGSSEEVNCPTISSVKERELFSEL